MLPFGVWISSSRLRSGMRCGGLREGRLRCLSAQDNEIETFQPQMPVKHTGDYEASPYIRLTLALGRPPAGRIRGWVAAISTSVSHVELIVRYGDALRVECADAGFVPACAVPLVKQSPEARAAATRWAARVISEGTY